MRLSKSLRGLFAGLLIAFASLPAQAALQYSSTLRSAYMTSLVTALGGTANLMLLTGAQPANLATVDSGTVLVVIPLSATAGTVSAGVLTFNAFTNTLATANGTAGHFLLCTTSNTANCVAVSSTTRVSQGSVGLSGADMNLAAGVTFTIGETIGVSSATITAFGA